MPDTVQAANVWPLVGDYTSGGAITMDTLENNIDDAELPDAQKRLTTFVNGKAPVLVETVEGHAPYTAVIRATFESVEGPVDYYYLANF